MPRKVFELANEVGMRPLDLVEKLKGIGLNVRNHMAVLSDEDLAKAKSEIGDLGGQAEAPVKKKVVKKKVAKKAGTGAVVKKTRVVRKKTTEAPAVEAQEAGDEEAKPNTTVKRRVVRRKSNAASVKVEEAAPAVATEATEVQETPQVEPEAQVETVTTAEASSTDSVVERPEAKDQGPKPRGLQIISRPEVKQEVVEESAPAEKAAAPQSKTEEPKKEVFREKMHTFTPVFIPEEKPKPKEEANTTESRGPKPADSATVDNPNAPKSKKRLGDLAAMMSKPKGTPKSRDLTQIRAEEELKSYSAGVLGQGYYVPARRKRIYNGPSDSTRITTVKDSKRVVTIKGVVTGAELAKKLKQKFKAFANQCLDLNLLVAQEDYFGPVLAGKVAALFDYRVEDISFKEEEILNTEVEEDTVKNSWPLRNPVVTVMGHVDHGKTTLLDHIRKEKVASGEAGGITQHIGAYSVPVKDSHITFLDTPGHAAFGSMRQRGANLTDMVILVVAADDGVMPQTKESVKYCQNAGVPIIIAVNKMDKEGANPDRIKNELTEFGITPEEWGGETQFVEISALKGDGVDSLLESVMLQAEMMELRADPAGRAEGIVIESKIESGRGPAATILIQRGTLKKGDSIVVGETYGRARSLMDHSGKMLKEAGPSTPIQIIGLNTAPAPGDTLNSCKNEREARKIVDNRAKDRLELQQTKSKSVNSLEDFFALEEGSEEKKVLKLIVRSDVQGSYEAIKTSLESLGNDEVGVEVIGGGVGAITDNDVMLAESAQGYIVGFNMRPITSARRLSEQKGVDVKTYTIIYELIDDIKAALEGMLDPERIEIYIGRAEVKDTFSIPKIGLIAGSAVIDGKIQAGCNIRLLREGKIVFDGKMSSLKRFKDDAKEVVNGQECGIGLENFNDVKVSDVFEAYKFEEKQRKLESNLTL